MSFILDALRKAEDKNRDRHNMSVPQGPRVLTDDLPEAPPAERNSSIILILMGAVIASALWWFMRDTSPEQPARTVNTSPVQTVSAQPARQSTSQTEQAGNPLPAERPNIRRDTGARALDREAQRGEPPRIAESTSTSPQTGTGSLNDAPSSQTQPVTPGTVTIMEADGSLPQSAPALVATPSPQVQEETLPNYRASLTAGDVPVPQLHLDIHVYSNEPEKRFVFINLEKYGEGDSIDKNTTVESIEPSGAVINHKGYRFVLQPD